MQTDKLTRQWHIDSEAPGLHCVVFGSDVYSYVCTSHTDTSADCWLNGDPGLSSNLHVKTKKCACICTYVQDERLCASLGLVDV